MRLRISQLAQRARCANRMLFLSIPFLLSVVTANGDLDLLKPEAGSIWYITEPLIIESKRAGPEENFNLNSELRFLTFDIIKLSPSSVNPNNPFYSSSQSIGLELAKIENPAWSGKFEWRATVSFIKDAGVLEGNDYTVRTAVAKRNIIIDPDGDGKAVGGGAYTFFGNNFSITNDLRPRPETVLPTESTTLTTRNFGNSQQPAETLDSDGSKQSSETSDKATDVTSITLNASNSLAIYSLFTSTTPKEAESNARTTSTDEGKPEESKAGGRDNLIMSIAIGVGVGLIVILGSLLTFLFVVYRRKKRQRSTSGIPSTLPGSGKARESEISELSSEARYTGNSARVASELYGERDHQELEGDRPSSNRLGAQS